MNWVFDMFNKKGREKKAELEETQDERKVRDDSWVTPLFEEDLNKLDKNANEAQIAEEEIRGFTKEAAYEFGDSEAETIKKDYKLRVSGLSDYNLAEMLSEYTGRPKNKLNEAKENQLKYVKNNRQAAEKKLLDAIGEHTKAAWKEAFEKFEKSEVKRPTEEDLYGPAFKPGKQNWEKKVDYTPPSDKEDLKNFDGVGKEEEKGQVGKEASYYETSPETWHKTQHEKYEDTSIEECPLCKIDKEKRKGYTKAYKKEADNNVELTDIEPLDEKEVGEFSEPKDKKDKALKKDLDDKVTEKIDEKIEEKTEDISDKVDKKIEEHEEEVEKKVEKKVDETVDEAFEKHHEKHHETEPNPEDTPVNDDAKLEEEAMYGKEIAEKEALLKCPECGSKNVTPAEGHKLNKCDSCHTAFDDESSKKEAKKMSDDAQDWISKKIEKLVEEGKSQDQAAAIAYSMAREKGYDVPKKSSSKKEQVSKESQTIKEKVEKKVRKMIDEEIDKAFKEHEEEHHPHYENEEEKHEDKQDEKIEELKDVQKNIVEEETEEPEHGKADFVEKESDIDIESKKNEEVIKMFVNDSFPKDKRPVWGTANLKITKQDGGWALINYWTPILFRRDSDGQLFFNTQKYSVTTSKIQNQIRDEVGGSAKEVDEDGIRQAIKDASTEYFKNVQDEEILKHKEEKEAPVEEVPGEIKSKYNKKETVKKLASISKKAEVESPWKIMLNDKGEEVIAKVLSTRKKKSEDDEDLIR